jgi:hypothetical protein
VWKTAAPLVANFSVAATDAVVVVVVDRLLVAETFRSARFLVASVSAEYFFTEAAATTTSRVAGVKIFSVDRVAFAHKTPKCRPSARVSP